jgi:hypothetical protein
VRYITHVAGNPNSVARGDGGDPRAGGTPPGAAAWRWPVFLAPFALLAAQLTLKLRSPERYAALNREGGAVEVLQVVVLLLAAAAAGAGALRARRSSRTLVALGAAVVTLGLLVVAGEEVSWGQRVLGMGAPEFFRRHNVQGEITLHNLAGMSYVNAVGYGLVAFLGAFGWLVAGRLPCRLRRLAPLVPGWYLSSWFLVAGLTYAWHPLYEHVGHRLLGIGLLRRGLLFGWDDQEPAELLLYAGVLLLLWHACRRAEETVTPPR